MIVYACISVTAKYIEYSRVAERFAVNAAYMLSFEINIHLFGVERSVYVLADNIYSIVFSISSAISDLTSMLS